MTQIVTTILILLGLVTGGSLFLLFRRGSKIDYNPEGFSPDLTLSPEEKAEVLETTFEVLEVEHEQDKEFENNVSKIKDEVSAMSDDYLTEYANSFFPKPDDKAIVVTDDKPKFDWEDTASTDT